MLTNIDDRPISGSGSTDPSPLLIYPENGPSRRLTGIRMKMLEEKFYGQQEIGNGDRRIFAVDPPLQGPGLAQSLPA